jgi:hypothetical protein
MTLFSKARRAVLAVVAIVDLLQRRERRIDHLPAQLWVAEAELRLVAADSKALLGMRSMGLPRVPPRAVALDAAVGVPLRVGGEVLLWRHLAAGESAIKS